MSARGLTGRRGGPKLSARALDRRITLRTMTRTPDGGGGYTETPTVIDTVWARVRPLEGTERLQAMETGMTQPHEFTIRYRDDVDGATDVLYDGDRYDVKSAIDTEARHREIVILADKVED